MDIPSFKTGQQIYHNIWLNAVECIHFLLYIEYWVSEDNNNDNTHHHHHQKAFRNKSHTSHGHRPGLKRNKSKGKRLTIN